MGVRDALRRQTGLAATAGLVLLAVLGGCSTDSSTLVDPSRAKPGETLEVVLRVNGELTGLEYVIERREESSWKGQYRVLAALSPDGVDDQPSTGWVPQGRALAAIPLIGVNTPVRVWGHLPRATGSGSYRICPTSGPVDECGEFTVS